MNTRAKDAEAAVAGKAITTEQGIMKEEKPRASVDATLETSLDSGGEVEFHTPPESYPVGADQAVLPQKEDKGEPQHNVPVANQTLHHGYQSEEDEIPLNAKQEKCIKSFLRILPAVPRETVIAYAEAREYNLKEMVDLFEKYDRSHTMSTGKDEPHKSVMVEAPKPAPIQVIYMRDPKEMKALELKANMTMCDWKTFLSLYESSNDGRTMRHFLTYLDPTIKTVLRRNSDENPDSTLDIEKVREMFPREFEKTIVIPFLLKGAETVFESAVKAIRKIKKLNEDSSSEEWSECIVNITLVVDTYGIETFTKEDRISIWEELMANVPTKGYKSTLSSKFRVLKSKPDTAQRGKEDTLRHGIRMLDHIDAEMRAQLQAGYQKIPSNQTIKTEDRKEISQKSSNNYKSSNNSQNKGSSSEWQRKPKGSNSQKSTASEKESSKITQAVTAPTREKPKNSSQDKAQAARGTSAKPQAAGGGDKSKSQAEGGGAKVDINHFKMNESPVNVQKYNDPRSREVVQCTMQQETDYHEQVEIMGKQISALLDTGGGRSLITRAAVNLVGLEPTTCERRTLNSMVSPKTSIPLTVNQFVQGTVHLTRLAKSFPFTAYILEDADGFPDLLLGSQFCRLTHVISLVEAMDEGTQHAIIAPQQAPEALETLLPAKEANPMVTQHQDDSDPETDPTTEDLPMISTGKNHASLGNFKLDVNPEDLPPLSIEEIDEILERSIAPDFPLSDELIIIIKEFIKNGVITRYLDSNPLKAKPYKADLKPDMYYKGVPPRIYPEAHKEAIKAWIDKMLKQKVIRLSHSTKSSPLHVVKQGNKYRVTQDLRILNSMLESHWANLPIAKDVVQSIAGKKHFGKFDLLVAYHQLPAEPVMRDMFAFSSPQGVYEYIDRMPMGEKNVPAYFAEVMRSILQGLGAHYPCYFDDIIIASDTPEAFCAEVKALLVRCKEFNVKLALDKFSLGLRSISAVGFEFDESGYKPLKAQLVKFASIPFPKSASELRTFLGHVEVFHDFIPDLHKITCAFSELRKKNAPYIVTAEMEQAFHDAQYAVKNIRMHFFIKVDLPLILDTDASERGTGGCLHQLDIDGSKRIIRFTSHTFSGPAMRWDTITKEAYAIIHAVDKLRYLLVGRHFTLRTDHRNLLWMSQAKNHMIQRWFTSLFLYDFDIVYIPGPENKIADALSRLNIDVNVTPEMPSQETGTEAYTCNAFSTEPTMPDPPLQELFTDCHNSIIGHAGIDGTIQRMTDAGAPTKNLRQRVIALHANCLTCEKARATMPKRPRERHSLARTKLFDVVQADFIQSLPETVASNKHILVFIDCFTRWVFLFACADTTTASAKAGLLSLYGTFGAPVRLITDGGPAFIDSGFQEFTKTLQIQHNTTIAHWPQAHGMVEAANKQVMKHLRSLTQELTDVNENTWDTFLPIITALMNNTVHSATGYAPVELVFGSAATASRQELGFLPDVSLAEDRDTYLAQLDNILKNVNAEAADRQDMTTIEAWRSAPQTSTTFEIGDFVLIPNRKKGNAFGKLAFNFVGPMQVQDTTESADIYCLQDLTQDVTFYAHSATFIPVVTTETEARAAAARDSGEHKITTVLEHVGNPARPSTLHFHVKWDDNSTSWLQHKDCKHVDVVTQYMEEKDLQTPRPQVGQRMSGRKRLQSSRLKGHAP